jgi:DNA polymerase elongation subunit (family B)
MVTDKEPEGGTFSKLVADLNVEWPAITKSLGCTRNFIKLEFEKTYGRMLLITAKRYAAVFTRDKGKPVEWGKKVEVKGLEYKRGDAMRIARRLQKEIIDALLRKECASIDEVTAIVDGYREKILKGDVELDDIMITQSVKSFDEYKERYTSKNCGGTGTQGRKAKRCGYDFGSTDINTLPKCPQCGHERKQAELPIQARVAKIMADRGEDVSGRVEYLIVKRKDGAKTLQAIPARDPGALQMIDHRYYWHDRVYPPTERVLQAIFPSGVWVEKRPKDLAIVEDQGSLALD